MNNWCALHVLTGSELEVLRGVRAMGYPTIVPMEMRREREGGRIRERLHVYVPGYVFVNLAVTPGAYYAIRAVPGVIRFLGGGTPESIPDEQMRIMLALAAHGETMRPAQAKRQNGKTIITGGPLTELNPDIIAVDARNGRATIRVQVLQNSCRATVQVHIQPD